MKTRTLSLLLILLLLPTLLLSQRKSYLSPLQEVQDVRAQALYSVKSKDNGSTCPIIKVRTSIDRGDLQFDTDLASTIEEIDATRLGQIWIYLSPGAMQLKVFHRKFEETLAFKGLIAGRVYETTIDYEEGAPALAASESDEADTGGQFFILRTDPQEVEVKIDGGAAIATTNGYINQFLPTGRHTYSVTSPLYAATGGEVYIQDQKVEQKITLKPQFGYIALTSSPSGARVAINGMEMGQTPFTTSRLPLGEHVVRLTAMGYEPVEQTVTISGPAATVNVSHAMVSFYTSVSLKAAVQGATILVNGESKGVDSWSGDLTPGEYIVTTTLTGYKESTQRIVVTKGKPLTLTLDAPTPMYGKLMVNSSQPDIVVTLDGKQLGTAPDVFSNILAGSHTVVYSAKGHIDKSEQITIEEGKTAQTVVTLTAAPVATAPVQAVVAPKGMVFVEGGTFKMGSTSGGSDEKPVHNVTLSSFCIGKYEVTQAEWESVMGNNPSRSKGANKPVEKVSWYDCVKFCNALSRQEGREECYKIEGETVTLLAGKKGYRLPTEAEWEYAARGGNKSKGYTYSGSNTIGSVAWYKDNSNSTTHVVGTKQPNELGIYDMSGNVWEWCWDWYGRYSSNSQTNPTGAASGSNRVYRGGSYYDSASRCRSSFRSSDTPTISDSLLGLRLVSCP